MRHSVAAAHQAESPGSFARPRTATAVARLIHQLTHPMRDFEDYLACANLKSIEEFWPLCSSSPGVAALSAAW